MARAGWLVMLVAISGCATPALPGWKTSKWAGTDCEQHRGFVVTDADGQLREFDHPNEFAPNWPDDDPGPGPGPLQFVRGQGGWWVANKGWPGRHVGSRPGRLLWLGDGEQEFELVGSGSYVGVFEHDGETLAVRRECDFVGFAIVERIESTADGWATPVELRRFGGVCPTHATGDHEGRPLLIGLDDVEYQLALFRVEDDRLRQLAVIPDTDDPHELPDQLEWTPDGDLLLSSGWWVGSSGPSVAQMDERIPGARVLHRIDDDQFVAGHLVRECRATPLSRRRLRPSPEDALGVIVNRQSDETIVLVRPDYARLDLIVDFVIGLTGPVRLEFRGVGLGDRADELLRLSADVELILDQSVGVAELERLRTARPDLFGPGNWSMPRYSAQ